MILYVKALIKDEHGYNDDSIVDLRGGERKR